MPCMQHTNRSAGAKRRQRRPRTPAQASGVRTHGPWHWRRAVLHAADDTQIAGPNPVLGRSRTQGDDPTSRVVVRQLQRRYIYPTPTRANGHQKDDPQPPRNITFQKRRVSETSRFKNMTFWPATCNGQRWLGSNPSRCGHGGVRTQECWP